MQRPVLIASLTAGALVAQQLAGKACRDTLFLSAWPASALPAAMLVAALASLAASLALALVLRRFGPRPVVPLLLATSGGLYALEWTLASRSPRLVAYLLFVHLAIFGASVISGFWSVVNERFDPRSAKQAMSRIVAGSTLGGVLGGLLAERTASLFGPQSTLLLLAALALAAAPGTLLVGAGSTASARAEPQRRPKDDSQRSYFAALALLSLSTAVMSALVEYTLKVRAAVAYPAPAELMQLFSYLYTGSALATFVVQLAVGKQALEKLGLGLTLAILPAGLALSAGAAAIFGGVVPAAIAGAALTVLSNSVYRAGYEILYTPVAPAQKRTLKVLIDVASTRLGDALGSGAIILFLALDPALAPPAAAAAAAVVALSGLLITRAVHQGYVRALSDSLRRGLLAIEAVPLGDATTRKTVTQTHLDLDRGSLLQAIEAHHAAELRAGQEDSGGAAAEGPTQLAIEPTLAAPLQAFLRGDDRLISRTLENVRFEPCLVPFAIRLLADARHATRARVYLEHQARALTGQLGDAALDPALTAEVRAACLDLLSRGALDRGVPALLAASRDAVFAVRVAAAETLLELRRREMLSGSARSAALSLAREAIDPQGALFGPGSASGAFTLPPRAAQGRECPSLVEVLRGEADPRVRLVFALLATARSPKAIIQAFRALASGDEGLGGTALEYLENVLPEELRRALWPLICGPTRLLGQVRAPVEVISEVARSQATILPSGLEPPADDPPHEAG